MNEADIGNNGIRSWLYETFCVSNVLANSQSIKDRILLEYVPSGQEYIKVIVDAMKENRVLNITYHSYWKDEENNFDVQPYCVKLFRQRWYLIGLSTYTYFNKQGPRIYSLDRIRDLQVKDETFTIPKDWDAKDYFAGCYGIIAGENKKVESIKIKVSAGHANYMRDLPLHESQEETERNEEYSIFNYQMRITFDLLQELLRNGSDIEVLKPSSLRRQMADMIEQMLKKYKNK